MIENPKNLTEQLLNLVERVAVEIKAIYNKLKTAVFKVNGISPDADGNVEISSVAEAIKASQDGNGNVIADTYLTKTGKAVSAGSADIATKATQDASGNDITATYATKTENNAKAPTSHASTATTYGIGTESNYGHVKLSDSTSSTSAANAGIAASPKAVKAAYDLANTANTAAANAINVATTAQSTANTAKTTADAAFPKTGGGITGDVTITGTLTIQ